MSSFYRLSFILGVPCLIARPVVGRVCGASWYSYGASWTWGDFDLGRVGVWSELTRNRNAA